jgi:hypothetical protein
MQGNCKVCKGSEFKATTCSKSKYIKPSDAVLKMNDAVLKLGMEENNEV